jgi:DNA-binding CsgD family transcriptional regulator
MPDASNPTQPKQTVNKAGNEPERRLTPQEFADLKTEIRRGALSDSELARIFDIAVKKVAQLRNTRR